MLRLMSTAGVVLTSDRDVPYSTVENALHEQGFLEGYLIHIRPARDRLVISIQVSVPVSWDHQGGCPRAASGAGAPFPNRSCRGNQQGH
jgi:hypothetical protein